MTISQSVPVAALERGFGLASSLREVSPSEGKGEEVWYSKNQLPSTTMNPF